MQASINAHVAAQHRGVVRSTANSTPDFSDQDCLPLEPKPKVRRKRGMTYEKLYQQIVAGYGQGNGCQYQPWLQIRRKNPSPKSNQVVAWLPPLGREGHFFSRGEYHTALLLLWLGVSDLREQYPIWPVPHPHPLERSGDLANARPWSKGLLAIAEGAGISHGYEIGSRQPYVATIDIMATVKIKGSDRLFTLSSKPISDPDDDVRWRTLERLELERRYALEIDSIHVIASSALIPIAMAGYLEWWLDAAILSDVALAGSADRFTDAVSRDETLSIYQAVRGAATELKLDMKAAWLLFRHCCWMQKIDIDPSQPLLTSYPIKKGGWALREAIRIELFHDRER